MKKYSALTIDWKDRDRNIVRSSFLKTLPPLFRATRWPVYSYFYPFQSGFRIRIDFKRIRMQHFFVIADPDPGF